MKIKKLARCPGSEKHRIKPFTILEISHKGLYFFRWPALINLNEDTEKEIKREFLKTIK